MTIKAFTQGKNVRIDRELFGLVGPWLVDKKVHETLGAAITCAHGDLWFVAVDGKGNAKGFITARRMKNESLHVRFVFCAGETQLVYRALIKHAVSHAEETGCTSIWTNDRETATAWKSFGFVVTSRARGAFARWEKPLQESA